MTLEVRRFNRRAITVYERAGFRLVDDPEPTADDPQRLLTMELAQASATRSR